MTFSLNLLHVCLFCSTVQKVGNNKLVGDQWYPCLWAVNTMLHVSSTACHGGPIAIEQCSMSPKQAYAGSYWH